MSETKKRYLLVEESAAGDGAAAIDGFVKGYSVLVHGSGDRLRPKSPMCPEGEAIEVDTIDSYVALLAERDALRAELARLRIEIDAVKQHRDMCNAEVVRLRSLADDPRVVEAAARWYVDDFGGLTGPFQDEARQEVRQLLRAVLVAVK